MHGWVESMEVHPQFPLGSANGWALMAMSELLDVLPEDHAEGMPYCNNLKNMQKD
jgi:rhamnogalacturonyl hydrolase YesR